MTTNTNKNVEPTRCGYIWHSEEKIKYCILSTSTVGGHVIAYFADKYGSENSKFLTTQTTYEVTAAFICISEGGG